MHQVKAIHVNAECDLMITVVPYLHFHKWHKTCNTPWNEVNKVNNA